MPLGLVSIKSPMLLRRKLSIKSPMFHLGMWYFVQMFSVVGPSCRCVYSESIRNFHPSFLCTANHRRFQCLVLRMDVYSGSLRRFHCLVLRMDVYTGSLRRFQFSFLRVNVYSGSLRRFQSSVLLVDVYSGLMRRFQPSLLHVNEKSRSRRHFKSSWVRHVDVYRGCHVDVYSGSLKHFLVLRPSCGCVYSESLSLFQYTAVLRVDAHSGWLRRFQSSVLRLDEYSKPLRRL